MRTSSPDEVVDVLVLGAGWTSQFLVPLLESKNISFALTTRTGEPRDCCLGKYDTSQIIPFHFETESTDEAQYSTLPSAKTVVVTYKLDGAEAARRLHDTYTKTHSGRIEASNWILLGSTGIYEGEGKVDHESDYKHNNRTDGEDEMIKRGGVVLCLAGLWGSERQPRNWVKRVAPTKEKLKEKKSLHLIHGDDVARACLAVHERFYPGNRWIVTDRRCWDWWDLIEHWAEDLEEEAEPSEDGQKPEYRKWIAELQKEEGISTLPRDKAQLKRELDSSHFWDLMNIQPRRKQVL